MIKIKTYRNTVLVKFYRCNKIDTEDSFTFRKVLINKLTNPFSNILVDFEHVVELNPETIEALIDGQRMSKMNRGQLSLFNVKENVFKSLINAKVDHLFFFCDVPKPFSGNLIMA